LEGLYWGGDGSLPASFYGHAFDLNGDGSPEYFLKTTGGGSGGPAYTLIGRDKGEWKKLRDFQGIFHVLKAEEKSWPKLVTTSKGGGGNFCKRHFEFEDGAYVETLRENFNNGEIKITERPKAGDETSQAERKETRVFSIAGYIPKFPAYSEHEEDPFAEPDPGEIKGDPAPPFWSTKYQDNVASFLRDQGIKIAEASFELRVNALFLTDTSERLDLALHLLRYFFSPDLQLSGIERTRKLLQNDQLFEDQDRLTRTLISEDLTVRTFHNEIQKLKGSLEGLPPDHDERAKIEERLAIAKKYLDSSRRLYLESLDKQEALIKEWQVETLRTGQDGRGTSIRPIETPKER
jgi:hypothetical protein